MCLEAGNNRKDDFYCKGETSGGKVVRAIAGWFESGDHHIAIEKIEGHCTVKRKLLPRRAVLRANQIIVNWAAVRLWKVGR